MKIFQFILCMGALACAIASAAAASLLPADSVTLDSLAAFKEPGASWSLASAIAGDPRREKTLVPVAGRGIVVNTATQGSGSDLITTWEHGDIELDLEFLMPVGSNSGVYLQGRYEVQLFDSWGVAQPTFSDCGGIYQRWIEAENRGYEGVPPRVNACRAPGLWQRLHIVFQAPRFDASGAKTANARFVEVALNGFVIHENVEVTGPTRGAEFDDERALAPLVIQGDHGPVALRRIATKHFKSHKVSLSDLACAVRRGAKLRIGDYDGVAPDLTPAVTEIDPPNLGVANNFAATYTGSMHLPAAGVYAFHATGRFPVRLIVDDQTVVLPVEAGGRGMPVQLAAGAHPFRLDYAHGEWGSSAIQISVEGPGLRMQTLTPAPAPRPNANQNPTEMIIEPFEGRVRTQRCFTPFEPRKRLYTIAVGSPAGVHYAYDFDTAALLHVWSGRFLDTIEFWKDRAENQYGIPAGPRLTLPGKPVVSLLESSRHDFPDVPDVLWSPQGYTLEADGQPVFLARLSGLSIRDRVVATKPSRGLSRTLFIEGKHTLWRTGVLLAESVRITAEPGGGSFIIGDREYYLDVPRDAEPAPFVRPINGHDQLLVLVPAFAGSTTIAYTLVW